MKVGSLVMLNQKLDINRAHIEVKPHIKNIPVLGVIYTVRDIYVNHKDRKGIRIEEMVFGILPCGIELSVDIHCWREVQPPMEDMLKLLMEETQLEPA